MLIWDYGIAVITTVAVEFVCGRFCNSEMLSN